MNENKRVCVFCNQSTKLTREHALPNWLHNLFSNESMVINEIGIVGGPLKKWPSKLFQHKTKVICEDCNNGWMRNLEEQARPLLTNLINLNRLILSQKEQSILSFWAQKTLLMLNQAVPDGLKITSDLYQDLYYKKTASKKVLVQLGYRMSVKETEEEPIAAFRLNQISSIGVNPKIINEITKQKDDGCFVWKAILTVGHAVFEMIGHNMHAKLVVDTKSKVFTPIGPYIKDVTWPLKQPIEEEGGLEKIMSRG